MRTRTFALGLGFLSLLPLVACTSVSSEADVESGDSNLESSWFEKNVPKGSAEEKAVLALVNDKSMSTDEYVQKCDFSLAVSASIVDYRQGDEPADTSDDETFDTIAELDRLPFTDRPFWAAALDCAKEHYLSTAPTGGTCATGSSTVQQSALAIQVVLDGSGSMTSDNKWPAATGAVTELFSAQAAKNDPKVGMGLIGFSDSKDATRGYGPYPGATDVGIAPMDAVQLGHLRDRLANATPSSQTPLYAAVTGAYGYLSGFTGTGALASATKVIVVLTDGEPTDDKAGLLTYVAAHADDAQLFAVGIGPKDGFSYDPAYVGALAVAGGTRASVTCNPNETVDESKMCHFQVTPGAKTAAQIKDELSAAFEKIRTDVAACDIGLQKLGTGTVDPTNIKVTVKKSDGTEVAIRKNSAYGWSFDDASAPTKVLLRGKACNDLRGDKGAVARVEIACK